MCKSAAIVKLHTRHRWCCLGEEHARVSHAQLAQLAQRRERAQRVHVDFAGIRALDDPVAHLALHSDQSKACPSTSVRAKQSDAQWPTRPQR